MPKSRKTSHIPTGTLSVYDAAELLHLSPPTIRRYVDQGLIRNCYLVPATRERRIPAPSLLIFLKDKDMPIPLRLQEHVDAYNSNYKKSS